MGAIPMQYQLVERCFEGLVLRVFDIDRVVLTTRDLCREALSVLQELRESTEGEEPVQGDITQSNLYTVEFEHEFHRAKYIRPFDDNTHVFYLGDIEKCAAIPEEAVFRLPDHLKKAPWRATLVRLKDVVPIPGQRSLEAQDHILQHWRRRSLLIRPCRGRVSTELAQVEIFRLQEDQAENLPDWLVAEGLALPNSPPPGQAPPE